jgi:TolB protein
MFVWATAAVIVASSQPAIQPAYDIAVVATGESGEGLYVMRGDGSGAKLLRAQTGAILTSGSWSPDGKRIVYNSFGREDEGLLTTYPIPMHFPVYVMNADGSDRRRLLDVPIEHSFKWSPDGQRLVFSSGFEDPARDNPRVQRGLEAGSVAVYAVDVQGGKPARLTPLGQNRFASWSPDGRSVVFSGKVDDQNQDIYVVDADGTNLRRLTTTPTVDVQPRWSPLGDLIGWVAAPRPAQRETEGGVFVIRPDGSGIRQISRARASNVEWSPDGTHLLIGTALVNVSTGETTTQFQELGLDATFAPDGKTILYRSRDAGTPPSWSIFSVDLTGQNTQKIASAATSFSAGPLKK